MSNKFEEYTLYLDESAKDRCLCISGFIVKNKDTNRIEKNISNIKEHIFKDKNEILHCVDFNRYKKWEEKRKEIYRSFSELVRKENIVNLCVILDEKILYDNYLAYEEKTKNEKLFDNKYTIIMQNIIEMYTHFLCKVNGVGSIIYEARSNSNKENNTHKTADNVMIHDFYKTKINSKGISIITNEKICERIRHLAIIPKKDNNNCLQLSDFISHNFLNKYLYSNNNNEFIKIISKKLYNGFYDEVSQKNIQGIWGKRIIPFYSTIEKLNDVKEKLENENISLNKNNKKLIKEKENLKNKLDKIKKEKENLKNELDKIKKEKENLKNELDKIKKEKENLKNELNKL